MAKQASDSDRWVTIVVPIVVAVIGLVGIIITVALGSDDDDGAAATTEPTLELTGWSNKEVSGRVVLQFNGTSANIPRSHRVYVLAKIETATSLRAEAAPAAGVAVEEDPYRVSPPAEIDDDGSWTVQWVMEGEPIASDYEAVAARLVEVGPVESTTPRAEQAPQQPTPSPEGTQPSGTRPPIPPPVTAVPTATVTATATPTTTRTITSEIQNVLEQLGPEASGVIARAAVDIPPSSP